MADLTPKVPGDTPYDQYSVTTTEPISSSLAIVKGVVYTKDASGFLIVVVSTLANGIYQAVSDVESDASASGTNSVQCLGPRTRMLFDDNVGGLVPGEDVILTANTTQIVTGAKSASIYIGKVFEIYTKNTDNTKKILSEVGDKIIVETVQS